jgi:hypothetical protein
MLGAALVLFKADPNFFNCSVAVITKGAFKILNITGVDDA